MKISEWRELGAFVWGRVIFPFGSVSFVLYFVFIVFIVGIGGSMISAIPAFVNLDERIYYTSLSLVGYSTVLLCSSSIDLIFIRFVDEEEGRFPIISNGIRMLGVVMVLLGIIFALVAFFIVDDYWRLGISLFSVFLAIIMWWITNSRTHSVLNTEPVELRETTGGNGDYELKGDTGGYKV